MISPQEWLDRADAYMDYSSYHPTKDIAAPAVTALRAVLELADRIRGHADLEGEDVDYRDPHDGMWRDVAPEIERVITEALT